MKDDINDIMSRAHDVAKDASMDPELVLLWNAANDLLGQPFIVEAYESRQNEALNDLVETMHGLAEVHGELVKDGKLINVDI